MFDVLTIGAATRDVFLLSKHFTLLRSELFETGVGECVSLGSKIEIETIVPTTGGGATNAAVTFARLGFKTATVCRIGADGAGRDVVAELKKENISSKYVRVTKKGLTAYSTLLTAPSGERTVLVYRGVSSSFVSTDIPWGIKTRWMYLTSLGGNLSLVSQIIRQSIKSETKIAWNPGRQELEKGMPAFKKILSGVSILILNREEAKFLAGKNEIPEITAILSNPNRLLLITDGEKGAYVHKDGKTSFLPSSGKKALSRTGAGDAFGSGFVAGWMKTGSLDYALKVASANAESVIQHVGAKK